MQVLHSPHVHSLVFHRSPQPLHKHVVDPERWHAKTEPVRSAAEIIEHVSHSNTRSADAVLSIADTWVNGNAISVIPLLILTFHVSRIKEQRQRRQSLGEVGKQRRGQALLAAHVIHPS